MRAFRIILRIVGVAALLALLVVILLDVGQPLAVGSPAPPVEGARLLDGRLATLNLRGRPTLVNIWATWCPPCLAELPDLVAVHHEWGERVRFVGLAADSEREAVLALVQRLAIDYDVAEIDAKTSRAWNASSLPSTFLVGADGKILWSTRGQLERAALEELLRTHVGPPPVRPEGEAR